MYEKNNTASFTVILYAVCYAQKPRARDIGIPFDGTPGKFNAITDVKGVEVGYSTIISGNGKKHKGQRPGTYRCYRYFTKRKKQ